jgi:predicted ATP-binding protein involved in virulence
LSFPAGFAALLAALAVAVAASGCGGDTVIDATKAEGAIATNLERSLHEKVTSVECPSGQKVEVGATFTCAIDYSNGKHATVTLKIRNKDADTDTVGYKQTK